MSSISSHATELAERSPLRILFVQSLEHSTDNLKEFANCKAFCVETHDASKCWNSESGWVFDQSQSLNLGEIDACVVDVRHLSAGLSTQLLNNIGGLVSFLSGIPVILVAEDDSHLETAITNGADDLLTAEFFDRKNLLRTVRSAQLRARQLRARQPNITKSFEDLHLLELINVNLDGLIVVDHEGTVLFANHAAERLLSHEDQTLVGSSFGAPVAEGESVEINIVREAEHGPEPVTIEMRVVGIEWNGQPAFLESLRDVTDHKKRYEEARHSIAARDQFLAALSHELRNPLATIINSAKVVKLEDSLNDEDLSHVEMIEDQAQTMKRLLEDLLDISRVSRGKISLNRQPVVLNDLVTSVVGSLRHQANSNRHLIHTSLADGPSTILGDRDRLRQILSNLLTNSIKYTPAGGQIRIQTTIKEEDIEILIRDNGCGIDPALLEEIFQPFTQLNVSIERSDGGMGMGLAIVKKMVDLHGGSISAHSQGADTGTEMIVKLPLFKQDSVVNLQSDAHTNRNENQWEKSRRLQVAIVEDQPALRRVTARLLEKLGHSVIEAEDGITGLSTITQRCPDVAIVDIGLPGIDGYEVARHARQRLGSSIGLVALTGYGQQQDRLKSIQSGFNYHLTKPASIDELQQVLQRFSSDA